MTVLVTGERGKRRAGGSRTSALAEGWGAEMEGPNRSKGNRQDFSAGIRPSKEAGVKLVNGKSSQTQFFLSMMSWVGFYIRRAHSFQ